MDHIIHNLGGLAIFSIAIGLIIIIYQAHYLDAVNWADLITTKGTNNVSLTKCLQLLGGITGTWVIVYITLHDKLTYDLLLVYLTYVGAIDGWSKYVSARFSIQETKPTPKVGTKD